MTELTAKLDLSKLDEGIEKANRMCELLREARQLNDSLFGDGKAGAKQSDDFDCLMKQAGEAFKSQYGASSKPPLERGEEKALKDLLLKLSKGVEGLSYSQCDLNDYASAICETIRTLYQCRAF